MKKVYSMFLALLAGAGLSAQVDVTFTVDMTGQTVDPTGVHLAGNFNDPDEGGATYPENYNASLAQWTPSALPLIDLGGGLWAVTIQLNPATYWFKFTNGNSWSGVEDVPSVCEVGGGNDNRIITIGTDPVDYTICWQSCAACGQKTVRFRVDMTTQAAVSPNGVHVAGDFQGWEPSANPLSDPDGNGIWEASINVGTASSIQFKFVNGNSWIGSIVESLPANSPCGNSANDNRTESLTSDNVVLPAYCFNSCGACVAPVPVTFRVDMSNETVEADGVHLAGAFGDAGYPQWSPSGIEMLPVGNNIYEVTLNLPPATYPYKFINGDTWDQPDDSNESLPADCNSSGNRSIVVGAEPQTVTFCYNQCSSSCVQDPDPAPVTFFVDLTGVTLTDGNVYMIGDFTTPQWQGGATLMTQVDGSSIYTCTVLVDGPADMKYKFVNGPVSVTANEENSGIEECGVPNGIGGFNRSHTRTGTPEVLTGPCFNSCAVCFVGVEEASVVEDLKIFPNPANDVLNVSFQSANVQDLTIRVINNMGQVVTTQTLAKVSGARLVTINVDPLAAGIYNLEIQNGKQSQVRRIAVN